VSSFVVILSTFVNVFHEVFEYGLQSLPHTLGRMPLPEDSEVRAKLQVLSLYERFLPVPGEIVPPLSQYLGEVRFCKTELFTDLLAGLSQQDFALFGENRICHESLLEM
jgi:hypothetical protein